MAVLTLAQVRQWAETAAGHADARGVVYLGQAVHCSNCPLAQCVNDLLGVLTADVDPDDGITIWRDGQNEPVTTDFDVTALVQRIDSAYTDTRYGPPWLTREDVLAVLDAYAAERGA